MDVDKIKLAPADFHPHLKARMLQRGVTEEEVEHTLRNGWQADDAKLGTDGKVFVFPYNAQWESKYFAEKEVTVYYKFIRGKFMLLTVKARYGMAFSKGGGVSENRI